MTNSDSNKKRKLNLKKVTIRDLSKVNGGMTFEKAFKIFTFPTEAVSWYC